MHWINNHTDDIIINAFTISYSYDKSLFNNLLAEINIGDQVEADVNFPHVHYLNVKEAKF